MTESNINGISSLGHNEDSRIDPATEVDYILKSLGSVGKYQKTQLFFILLFIMEDSFHLVSSVYIAYRPSYHCQDINSSIYMGDNHTTLNNESQLDVVYGKCRIDINVNISGSTYHYDSDCVNGFQYGIPKDRTTVTEWDLVCKGSERSEFAQTLIMLGQAIGAVIFSPLSDRFGRKLCSVVSRVLYFFTALATVFCPNITAFLIFRFLQGTFQGGSVMTSTILYIELLPKEHRHITEGLNAAAWSTGLVLTSIIGYLCRHLSWRYLQLILALITCHAVFDWLFYDESIRWLIANNKIKKTEQVLKKAARINNVDFEKVIQNIKFTYTAKNNMDCDRDEKTTVQRYNVMTILKNKPILHSSIILWIAWATNTLTYYGLMLTTSKLSGDRYLNNILACLAEFPAVILQQLLINRIGRKYVLIIFHAIAGVSLVLAMVCTTYGEEHNWFPDLGTAFSLIGRFAITGSFSTVFLYTSELYPTNLRNVGLGSASTVSRIGSMLSPFAMTLSDYIVWAPAAIFAGLNLFVAISLLALPETMGRELPTTVTELASWYKDNKGCVFFHRKAKYSMDNKHVKK